MLECPRCGLINPDGAETCDCGYSFTGRPSFRSRVEVKTCTYIKQFGTFVEKWSSKKMDAHVSEMMQDGWELVNSANNAGHLNVGRTVVPAMLTGGLSLLLGASRSAETITLTFKRVR
jgi:hypothetical protein